MARSAPRLRKHPGCEARISPSTTAPGTPSPNCCPIRRPRPPSASCASHRLLRAPPHQRARFADRQGSSYRSHRFREACQQRDKRHARTRPYTPRTNGKAERFIQTGYTNGSTPTLGRQEQRDANCRLARLLQLARPHGSLATSRPSAVPPWEQRLPKDPSLPPSSPGRFIKLRRPGFEGAIKLTDSERIK